MDLTCPPYRLIDIEAFEVASLKETFVEHRDQTATTASSNSVLKKARLKKTGNQALFEFTS
jgi:hypothetical protein